MGKNFTNKEISELLRGVAAAYAVKDEQKHKFQIIAYERAADSIEHSSSEVKDLWDEGKLNELAGIGPSIYQHLDELFKKGRVSHFEEVSSGLPKGMFPLLKVPGIGPKTAFKLAGILKLRSPDNAVEKLKRAVKDKRIQNIEGFGEVSEAKILKGLEETSRKVERILLPIAAGISSELINYLLKSKYVVRVDPLGSLRRKCSTVGDIDISVASDYPREVIKHFLKYPAKKRILESGNTTASLIHRVGYQIDLMVQPLSAYGALLQHFTGSKLHNIKLREMALKKGWSLSEYGIRKIKGQRGKGTKVQSGKLVKFPTEEEFYHYLGMEWIPPELREDTGEIEAALRQNQCGLPKLVKTEDIMGDFHLHSNFPIEPSHDLGLSSLEEMVNKAEYLKYKYLLFTEHNPSLNNHSHSEIINLLKSKKEYIEHLNSSRTNKIPIKIFNGLEIDIRPNGDLAIPEEGFKYLDFAIVSVHSQFDLDREKMTERVIRGLSQPKAKIFGHPTGRILNRREGYELDWERVFNFCVSENKFLEISAYPERLDLPDFLVREAIKKGVKLTIGTDSHQVEQMELMEYGVSVARRGWAEVKDILNTYPLEKLKEVLKL